MTASMGAAPAGPAAPRPALRLELAPLLKVMLLTELRLRMRRGGTLFAALALIVVTWLMIEDPSTGRALIVIDHVRVAYTSTCLATGSAMLAGMLFGLAGFYLVRGRMSEDLRLGAGAVIGATPVGNAVFLLGRWLGGVAYLCALMLAFLATMLVLHALRGEGPIEPTVYLRIFALQLLPLVLFVAGMALLFDAWSPLSGKGGDVLYFLIFLAQLTAGALASERGVASPMLLLDFAGLGTPITALRSVLDTSSLVIGGGDFDPARAPMLMPESLWTAQLVLARVGCGVLALLPLIPAVLLFHRYAPDRVTARAGASAGWSPLALANRALRPLARLTRPLFLLAARLPGVAGYALAVVALTLACNPAAILAVLALLVAGCVAPAHALGAVMAAAIAVWGIVVSDISVRDRQHDVDAMSACAPGGGTRRYVAHWLAACLLALVPAAPILLRWSLGQPLRAAALLTGVLALAAAASLLGNVSRTARTFLALYLFGFYVATQATKVAQLDVVGFNGAATGQSIVLQTLAGAILLALGIFLEKRQHGKK